METGSDKARQVMEETALDRETRSAGDFEKAENALPKQIGSRSNIPLMDNISSYLGASNPLAKKVDPNAEEVWLLDNTAYRPVQIYPHRPQPYQADFVAAFFKKNSGKDWSKAVANIADVIGISKEGDDRAETEKTIAHRLLPFVQTIAPARSVDVNFPDGSIHKLGPGGRSAVSDQTIIFSGNHEDGESVSIPAVPADVTPHGPVLTHFAAPEGWLVVSDIDDSIKITMTPNPIGILRSTFVSEPEPIAGMPELYAEVAKSLNPTWFYLSASPYNLYPFLRQFLHTYYTPGTIILRDASWMDLGGFLASLTQGTEAYKRSRMEKIHAWLPKRKVICVGDSTQSDPEAYGDICRLWPGWVKAVFIRKVTDVAEMKHTTKNDPERFENAFKDVPKDIWRTFEDPKELYAAVAQLKDV